MDDTQDGTATPPATAAGGAEAPIFIVGCQRSGTTMLRLILDSHSRISCGPETRFLEDMERIVGSDWKRLSQYGFPREEWLRRIAGFFGGIQHDYAVSRGKQRWADKSPRYAMKLAFIMRAVPGRAGRPCDPGRPGRGRLPPQALRLLVMREVGGQVAALHRRGQGCRAGAATGAYRELGTRTWWPTRRLPCARCWPSWARSGSWKILDFERHSHVPDPLPPAGDARRADEAPSAPVYRSRVGSYRKELDPAMRLLFRITSSRALKQLGYA